MVTLKRQSGMNGLLTPKETLIQLAGHLKGQPLQEQNLLEDSDKVSWQEVTCLAQCTA